MSKHTPGPWDVSESGSIGFEDGYLGEAYDFNATTETDLPMMANARLMAAAPELFKFLEELIWYCDFGDSEFLKTYEEVKKLIAKIEGDESNA